MRTVLELHEVPTMTGLRVWARAHGARVRYLGSTWERQEVYGARKGAQMRVCRTGWDVYRQHPVVWRSPLEHLPTEPAE
ncbi:hypothetical protein [Nocardiopsis synnemataformans]|uniref:hypothetical protein n=1 Tax=Nocardiopsis synnemataformans TaxID=61305 RepID=UPI003EBC0D3E